MSMLALAYKDLRDIDDVRPLGDQDVARLEELRAVLSRHCAIERFGIMLLHDHFPVYEGETLLETCDYESRTLTMQAVPTTKLDRRAIVETEWRFSTDSEISAAMTCNNVCSFSGGKHVKKHAKFSPIKS